jgi:hypothetical protein
MKFRHARHTRDLKKMEAFYTEIAGLSKLGGFCDHQGYDGLFIGHEGESWHLEFTSSGHQEENRPGEDELIVLYLDSSAALAAMEKHLEHHGIKKEIPRNPYWRQNGIMVSDPDGYKVVFALNSIRLRSDDELTKLVTSRGIATWSELLDFVRQLPYGRNANRSDLSLVISEGQGTCSSKHALLKKLADLNRVNNVKLIMGLYRMHRQNTPGIGDALEGSGLNYIPEAHCYLLINNKRCDLTGPASDFGRLENDLISELEIAPEQVDTFKVIRHQEFLKQWLKNEELSLSFEELWKVREICIRKLGE